MWDEILAPLFTTDWGRRLGWSSMSVMGLLLTLSFFQSVTTWHHDSVLAQTAPVKVQSISQVNVMDRKLAQLPAWHLFGMPGMTDTSGMPITSLQLQLVGVVKAIPERFSKVIISEAGQPGKVFQLGDAVADGVKIAAISDAGIILENGGKMEKLPLQRSHLQFGGMPKSFLTDNASAEE